MSGGRFDLYFGLPLVSFSFSVRDCGEDGLLGMPRWTESGDGEAGCEKLTGEKAGIDGVSREAPVESGAIEETTDEVGELEKNDLGPWSYISREVRKSSLASTMELRKLSGVPMKGGVGR